MAVGQQLDRVGAGVVAGAGVLGARVAEPHRQQVRGRARPSPAEQLALPSEPRRRRLRAGRSDGLRPRRPLLALGAPRLASASAASSSMADEPRPRLRRGRRRWSRPRAGPGRRPGWPSPIVELGDVDLDGGGDVGRGGVERSGTCSRCSTRPCSCSTALASPTRTIGTSAEMTSSRRTIWKSTWMTVWRTGWRCRARAMARWVSEPTCSDSSWLSPASPDRAWRSVRPSTDTGRGVAAVAVDHGGDPAGGAQPPRRGRPGGATGLGNQGDLSHLTRSCIP